MEKKLETSSDSLCKGFPIEMSQYVTYCKNLKFEDKPDYTYLRNLFKVYKYYYIKRMHLENKVLNGIINLNGQKKKF